MFFAVLCLPATENHRGQAGALACPEVSSSGAVPFFNIPLHI